MRSVTVPTRVCLGTLIATTCRARRGWRARYSTRMRYILAWLGSGFVTLVSAGCSDGRGGADGAATGSTCPPSSTLTYESFAQPFMARYCTSCHSQELTGASRRGAPSDHNFDSRLGIAEVAAVHLDSQAAAGPNAVNTAMPPDDFEPMPTEAERRQLGEWLACEQP